MLKAVFRWIAFGVLFSLLAYPSALPLKADDAVPVKPSNTFFAGTVGVASAEAITVARVVRGHAESRSFRLTPETKVEGTLLAGARVTVRYITDDDGDTATLIVVHAPGAAPKTKK